LKCLRLLILNIHKTIIVNIKEEYRSKCSEKGIQIEKLSKAFEKISIKNSHSFQKLIDTNDEKHELINRVAIKNGTEINIVSIEDILYVEAYGDYVYIHTKNGRFLKEKTMKYFELHLDANQFVRTHRSYIVNAKEILKIEHYGKENYVAILKNNLSLNISNSGYRKIKNVLNI